MNLKAQLRRVLPGISTRLRVYTDGDVIARVAVSVNGGPFLDYDRLTAEARGLSWRRYVSGLVADNGFRRDRAADGGGRGHMFRAAA